MQTFFLQQRLVAAWILYLWCVLKAAAVFLFVNTENKLFHTSHYMSQLEHQVTLKLKQPYQIPDNILVILQKTATIKTFVVFFSYFGTDCVCSFCQNLTDTQEHCIYLLVCNKRNTICGGENTWLQQSFTLMFNSLCSRKPHATFSAWCAHRLHYSHPLSVEVWSLVL